MPNRYKADKNTRSVAWGLNLTEERTPCSLTHDPARAPCCSAQRWSHVLSQPMPNGAAATAERPALAASRAARGVLAAEVAPAVGMRAAATAAAKAVPAAGTKMVAVARAGEVVPEDGVKVAATAAEAVPAVEVAPVAGTRAAVTAVEVGPAVGTRGVAMAAEAVPAVAFIGPPSTAEAATGRAGTAAALGWARSAIISLAGHTFTQAEAAVRSARSPRERRARGPRCNSEA